MKTLSKILLWAIFLFPFPAFAEGQLAALFEDAVEFNNRNLPSELISPLIKEHGTTPPADAVLFFNLFCEGDASNLGGTETVTAQFGLTPDGNGGGSVFFDMTICEFCECAGLQGQDFEDCHAAKESCATFNNALFTFDPILGDNILPDPDFPDKPRILFNMTQHDPATECTGKFKALCDQGKLDLVHHCTHILDEVGNVLKSISSAYIFSVKP